MSRIRAVAISTVARLFCPVSCSEFVAIYFLILAFSIFLHTYTSHSFHFLCSHWFVTLFECVSKNCVSLGIYRDIVFFWTAVLLTYFPNWSLEYIHGGIEILTLEVRLPWLFQSRFIFNSDCKRLLPFNTVSLKIKEICSVVVFVSFSVKMYSKQDS